MSCTHKSLRVRYTGEHNGMARFDPLSAGFESHLPVWSYFQARHQGSSRRMNLQRRVVERIEIDVLIAFADFVSHRRHWGI